MDDRCADFIQNSEDRTEVHSYGKAGHVFVGNSCLGSPYGDLALGGGEKSNKVATEDYQKVLLERLTQWPTH